MLWDSSTLTPQQGRRIYCSGPACVSSQQPMQPSGGRICRWGKSLRNLFLVLSLLTHSPLRSSSKLGGQAAKQESPITWCWLHILLPAFYRGPPRAGCIVTLPPLIPDAHQFISDLHFLMEIAARQTASKLHQRTPGSHLYHYLN